MRICLVLAVFLLGACGVEPQPPLVAANVVITPPVPGTKMSAAYMSLTNYTDQAISISRVASLQYESVQLHESTIEDGVARMRAIQVLEIPSGETVALRRGGKHLMLVRPTGPTSTVSLQFFAGDDLILTVDAGFASEAD